MSIGPNEAAALLSSLGAATPDQISQTFNFCLQLLAKDSLASLTLLPGLLANLNLDLSTENSISLLKCLLLILKTAANYEPSTALSIFSSGLEGLGTYSVSDQPQLLKEWIQSLTIIYPLLFRFLCRHFSDSSPWDLFTSQANTIESLLHHPNDGIKVAVTKFLQVAVLIGSPREGGDRSYPSIDDIPFHHPFLKSNDLRNEGVVAFNKLIAILSMNLMPPGVMTASIHSLQVICQYRSEFLDFTVKTLLQWSSGSPEHLSKMQKRSVERSIKIFMLTMLKNPAAESLLDYIQEFLLEVGVRSMEIRMRIQQKTSKKAFASDWEEDAKLIKTEQDFQLSDLFLRTVNITQIPYPILIEIIIHTLLNVTPQNWELGMNFYRQMNGILSPEEIAAAAAAEAAHAQAAEPVAAPEGEIVKEEAILIADADPESVVAPPRELSSYEKHQVFQEILHRFFESEYRFSGSSGAGGQTTTIKIHQVSERDTLAAAKSGWILLISRLLNRGQSVPDTPQFETIVKAKEILVSFILDSFKERIDLAILWLHEEYFKQSWLSDNADDRDNYARWFQAVLYGLQRPRNEQGDYALDHKDRIFTRFLMDSPDINFDFVFEVIDLYCNAPERMALGISTLRDIILYRPAVRIRCLPMLLQLCRHKRTFSFLTIDKTTRATAIVTCKTFYKEHASLGPEVEHYALATLKKLLETPEEEMDDIQSVQGEEENDDMMERDLPEIVMTDVEKSAEAKAEEPSAAEWKEADIIRHLEMYFSFCSKDHDFLDEIFKLFPDFTDGVKNVVQKHIGGLVKALSSTPEKLISLIDTFPKGSDFLILRMIAVMASADPIPESLIQSVRGLYQKHDLDARFLIPIITALPKNEILQELSKVFKLLDGSDGQKAIVRDVVIKLIQSPKEISAETGTENILPPIMTPAELLVWIHSSEESLGLKIAVEATSICFTTREYYNQETLAIILQKLLDLQKLPTLLMRTIIQTVTLYKELAGFINSILTRLIMKKIWTYPKLWDGFIRCCTIMFPSSLPVVYALPKAQAQEVFSKSPKLKEALRAFIDSLPPHQRHRREFKTLLPLVQ